MIISGRAISGGIAEGTLIVSDRTLRFDTDVDSGSGKVLDGKNRLFGQTLKDRILASPGTLANGSKADALSALAWSGCAPRALIMDECDEVIGQDAKTSRIPLVDGIELGLLIDNDDVVVDGNEGHVEVRNAELRPVVTCFLRHDDKILIMKRSDKVLTSKGKWAGVSGYVEEDETPGDTAFKEIREETGIENPVLVGTGRSVYVRNKDVFFQIHTFLFEVETDHVSLDWEHTEYKWIVPEDMAKYDTVPKLSEALDSVLLEPR